MNSDSYLSGYLDRKMSRIIDEWQISTRVDLADLTERFHRVQDDLTGLKNFERDTESRMTVLEDRIRLIREKQK